MFEIVFLGTSAAAPSVHRGLTSQVVLRGEHRFLIDGGEGTQRQILKSGLGFKRLDRVLVTHGHLDHILGLGGLISTFVRWEAMDKILIAGGKSALDRIRDLIFGVVLKGKYPPVLDNICIRCKLVKYDIFRELRGYRSKIRASKLMEHHLKRGFL